MAKLRLYIWTNFNPGWRGGIAFAIAKDEVEARKLISTELGYEPINWGELEVRRLDWRVAKAVSGGE